MSEAHPHINADGKFQSDKYPTCPPGKVPLSTKDPMAQDLLWEYAQRRRAVDEQFSDDLEIALNTSGYRTFEWLKEMLERVLPEPFHCHTCDTYFNSVDEDGCCSSCGSQCQTLPFDDAINAALRVFWEAECQPSVNQDRRLAYHPGGKCQDGDPCRGHHIAGSMIG